MSEARQEKAPFWLRDNFAPTFEERTESDLKVIGQITRPVSPYWGICNVEVTQRAPIACWHLDWEFLQWKGCFQAKRMSWPGW